MEENTNNIEVINCDEEPGTIKVNGVVVPFEQLPDYFKKQFESIEKSKTAIDGPDGPDGLIKKAEGLKDKAESLKEGRLFAHKKERIRELQEVASEMCDVLDLNLTAMKSFKDSFDKLSETSEVLLGLSLVNSTQRNILIKTITQKLQKASQEELNKLEMQEMERLMQQIKDQQVLHDKVKALNEKVNALNEWKKGIGWRCFLFSLLGCGVAFLAFYLFYHFM